MSKNRPILAAVAVVAAIGFSGAPAMAQQQQKRPSTMSDAIGTGLPVALWAITGGVLGAVVWPMVSTGQLVAAPITSVGALLNPGAAVGTVIGGVGYYVWR